MRRAHKREHSLGSKLRLRACLAVALVLLYGVGCADSGTHPGPPGSILLVTVDTLRSDHVGLYGYDRNTTPNIDRFFRRGAVFERAYATSSYTSASVVSMLTGQLPQQHGVRLFFQLVEDVDRLVCNRLPATYRSMAVVSNLVLTNEALGIGGCFDVYDDFVDERESSRQVFERNARRTTESALRLLREPPDPPRPVFLWVHYVDPHAPYRSPPGEDLPVFAHKGWIPVTSSRIPEHARLEGIIDALDYVDHYDQEIAFVDAQVRRLLETWGDRFPLDRSLVLFTSDHGETMIEGEQWFNHNYHVYEAMIRVPLMMRGEGVVPGRYREPVSGVDVAATLLAFAGVPLDVEDGAVDLRVAAGSGRRVFSESINRGGGQWRAMIQGDQKWVARVLDGNREIAKRLSHRVDTSLTEGAGEYWPPGESVASALLGMLDRDPDPAGRPASLKEGVWLKHPKVAPRAGSEDLKRLQQLGYVRPSGP